jgi:transposase
MGMNFKSLEEFDGQLLSIESPWEVQEVIRDGKLREVHVIVAYEADESPSHGVHQITVPWAEKNSRFTLELERHVCLRLREASISAVASMFDLCWDAVSGIQERAVNRGLAKRKTSSPKNIGIDETSFQKRHEYVSVILDKDNNTVLDVLQDRKAETLDGWFKTQKVADFKALRSISMDIWDAFIKAVKANFEKAESLIVFDRYHVAQHLNKAVEKVRAEEHRELMRKGVKSSR